MGDLTIFYIIIPDKQKHGISESSIQIYEDYISKYNELNAQPMNQTEHKFKNCEGFQIGRARLHFSNFYVL